MPLTSRAVALDFLISAIWGTFRDVHLIVVSSHLVQNGLTIGQTVTAHYNTILTKTRMHTYFSQVEVVIKQKLKPKLRAGNDTSPYTFFSCALVLNYILEYCSHNETPCFGMSRYILFLFYYRYTPWIDSQLGLKICVPVLPYVG